MIVFKYVLAAATIALTAASEQQFASDLFGLIAKEHADKNVLLSPTAIEMGLGLLYMAAEGSTAAELESGLRLDNSNKTAVSERFAKLLETDDESAEVVPVVQLRLANRLYLDKKYAIAPTFNQLAESQFGASLGKVDFSQPQVAAAEINAWVEQKTEHKIKDTVDPNSFAKGMASVLVSGLYFKAKWENIFSVFDTKVDAFQLDSDRQAQVRTMYQTDYFVCGDLKDLHAKAIQLPYQRSNISMLIIMPKRIGGLAALEEKLKTVDFTTLPAKLSGRRARVSLPKFTVEFDVSLRPTLEKLGIKEVFTKAANLSGVVTSKDVVSVSQVKHKAFMVVNEMGTAAAAATYVKIMPMSFRTEHKLYNFYANHPFVFALMDKEHTYLIGHIVNP